MSAAFLSIPEVRGEALDPQHVGWIEISSYSQNHHGRTEFSMTKAVDSSSPSLFQLAQTGHMFDAELDAVNNGRIVMHFGLTGAVVAALSLGGHTTEDGAFEYLTLDCASVKVELR